MSIERSEIEHVARLARLALEEGGVPGYQRDLSAILGMVARINEAQTGGLEPLAHPVGTGARMRPDEVTETDQRERFQAVAPGVEAGYYLVPRVIE